MNVMNVGRFVGTYGEDERWFELYNWVGNWSTGLSTTLYDVAFPSGDHPEHKHDWIYDMSVRALICRCGYYLSDRMVANNEPPHPPYVTEADLVEAKHALMDEPASEVIDWYRDVAETNLSDGWAYWDDIIFPSRCDSTYYDPEEVL